MVVLRWSCSAGAGLRRQQVVAGRHLAQRDAELGGPVLAVVVRGGAVLGVEGAVVGLRLELEVVCCVVLWQKGAHHKAFRVCTASQSPPRGEDRGRG